MKRLLGGILALLGASIVSFIIVIPLFGYSLGYSIWLSITFKNWKAFPLFWWRLIDGVAYAIGDLLYAGAYSQDQIWNTAGELIEDTVTHKENTMFTEPEITVSAALGKLKLEGKLNKFGLLIDKGLNIAFAQKNHTIGAWKYFQKRKEIFKEYFKPNN